MTRFWLIRHAQPVEEAHGRCYGTLDVGLSEAGRTQMLQAAEYLKTEPIAAIYSSPRARAIESARILADVAVRPVEIVEEFREIDFGDFEGLAYEEIAQRYPEVYRQWMDTPTEVRFPNGESFSDMRARVLGAFGAIHRHWERQTVAIVSHGGVNRILLAWALRMPDDCIFRLAQDYTAINLLAFVEGVPSVNLVNYGRYK
jgi:alpha-ribazole phosphatase/probable phosphoglycerate mutase